jgi:GT2 family glycosyltransferase
MTSSPRIAVIIVGYNSFPDLSECLSSLANTHYKSLRLYFIENGSSNESVTYVRQQFPRAMSLRSPENLGFAGGNNFLLREALKSDADAFFLLNPDTVVDVNCLENLVKAYRPDTLLQPLILLHAKDKKTQSVNTLGNPLHFLGFSYAGGNGEKLPQGEGGKIALASGAAVLIPRDILEKVGLFDESFFLYHEDADLSWRCRMYGYQIRSVYPAIVWHKYAFSRNSRKFFYTERNRLILLLKSYQARTFLILLPIIVLTELFLLLYAALNGWLKEKLEGYTWIVHNLPSIRSSREVIQRHRRLSDRSLYVFLSDRLQFSEMDSVPIKLYNAVAQVYWKVAKAV